MQHRLLEKLCMEPSCVSQGLLEAMLPETAMLLSLHWKQQKTTSHPAVSELLTLAPALATINLQSG